MSYFHLGEEAHVETEVTHHAMALDGPRVSAETIKSCAATALSMDREAYFRAFDGVIYAHWATERPVSRSRLEAWADGVRNAEYPSLDIIKPHTGPCPGLQDINGSLA